MDIKLLRDYAELKNKYEKIISENHETPLNRIFIHETGNLMNLETVREIRKRKLATDDELKEHYLGRIHLIPKIKKLLPLTDVKDFSKEYLTNYQSDLNEILEEEKKYSKNSYNVDLEISGQIEKKVNLYEPAIAAFLSTNIGDALKWSPKGETIKINLSEESNKIKLSIENKFSESPVRKSIGMGKKIGSQYSNLFLETIEGQSEENIIENTPYKIFKKTFTFPKN